MRVSPMLSACRAVENNLTAECGWDCLGAGVVALPLCSSGFNGCGLCPTRLPGTGLCLADSIHEVRSGDDLNIVPVHCAHHLC
jgi:hypothetical protein